MMSSMSDQATDAGPTPASRMGRAISRGVVVGIPLAIVGIAFAVYLITDLSLVDSFATAWLPGVLFGGFAGGFAGVAMTME